MTQSLANETVAFVLVGALVILVLLVPAYLIVLQMLFYRLRHSHSDYYQEIGAPSLFLNNSISKGLGVVRYLLDRDYLDVPDERVIQLGEYARRLLIFGFAAFGLCLLMFAALAITSGRFS